MNGNGKVNGKANGNLWVRETFVNVDSNVQFGNSDVYETWTDNLGKLYRDMVHEYGRCTGKVHLDTTDGKTLTIGWVFLERDKYENSKNTYLRETWVEVHKGPPTRTVEYDYAEV